ncbi:MAG: peptidoglycan-binding protein [Oscillospiraceae bacterium]|nr:peptidoglycan-binding protein [Oscillospiraceae bacterium]
MAYTDEEKKSHISEIQKYLRTISQTNKSIPTVIPTGVYDDKTAEAVRAFQKDYGLPVTGTVDRETWDLLFEVYLAVQEYLTESAAIMPFPDSEYSINEGDKNYTVYILQAMLNTIAEYYSNVDSVTMDGVYGKMTTDAVKSMQTVTGENNSGDVDYKTWNNIARLYNFHSMQYAKKCEEEKKNAMEKTQ